MTSPHDGHRKRVRDRFIHEGLDGFAPHEVLELLLFYGKARGDTNETAHRLLDTFGSLKAVLEAGPDELKTVDGIGEENAVLISMIVPLFRRYLSCSVDQRRIRNRTDAETVCRSLLTGCRSERFYLICLDARGYILGQKLIAEGTLGEVKTYPRLIVETALQHNAASVILTHNHPSGNNTPSAADINETLRISSLLTSLDIEVLDHIIVSGSTCYSMMQHNDLKA